MQGIAINVRGQVYIRGQVLGQGSLSRGLVISVV
jgi:hypothetical protein